MSNKHFQICILFKQEITYAVMWLSALATFIVMARLQILIEE